MALIKVVLEFGTQFKNRAEKRKGLTGQLISAVAGTGTRKELIAGI